MPLIVRIGFSAGPDGDMAAMERTARRVLASVGSVAVRPVGRKPDGCRYVEGFIPGASDPNGKRADRITEILNAETHHEGGVGTWFEDMRALEKGEVFTPTEKYIVKPRTVYVLKVVGTNNFVGSYGFPGASETMYVQASLQNADHWELLKEAQEMLEQIEEDGLDGDDVHARIENPVCEVWKMLISESREATPFGRNP